MGYMLNGLRCVLDEAAPSLAGDATVACECCLQGCGVVVAWGGCLLVCRKSASSLEWFWIARGRCLALWDSSSGEGAPTYPVDSGIKVYHSSCLLGIPVILEIPVNHIFSFGSPERLVKNFALTVQMGSVLEGQDMRPLEALAVPNYLDGVFSCPLFLRKVPSWTVECHPPRGRTSQPKEEELSFCHDRPKGFPVMPLFCPSFCLGRPKRVRLSRLDSFISRVCKGEGFEGFDLRPYFVRASFFGSLTLVHLEVELRVTCPCKLYRGYLIVRHLPCRSKRKRVRDKFSEKRELAHRSSPVANVPL
ncbi:hypothetical protein CRG98_018784 [Punica granatum]|uniref:Uncharacterized protein n=1 Tax=Punica granatum TaxID=22663 RepID=A0A2I0JWY4_PUNGR|nr:hypothetical protein CRG98_018784 [Punica granatum]